MVIRARYEDGVFKPLEEVKLKDGTVLEIYISSNNKKRASLKNFSFAGMWENRVDVTDGLSYVDRLRDNPRT